MKAIIRELETVVSLPKHGRPTKIPPRAQQRLIVEVTKEPKETAGLTPLRQA